MIYKAVPGPKVISITDGNHSSATNTFAAIINAEARNGWSYHSMETLTVEEKVGCDLQPQFVKTNLYMLIFYREDDGNTVQTAPVGTPAPSYASTRPVGGGNPAFGIPPQNMVSTTSSAPVPAKSAAGSDGWFCGKCGTKNSVNYGQCKKCGTFRG